MNEEAFEADDTEIEKRPQFTRISWNYAAPETNIHVTLRLGRLQLGLEALDGRRRRNRVERHVNDCRHAAGSGSAGCSGEAFPPRPARLINMNMRVYESRHHDRLVIRLDHFGTDGNTLVGLNGGYRTPTDMDRSWANRSRQHNLLASNYQVRNDHGFRPTNRRVSDLHERR